MTQLLTLVDGAEFWIICKWLKLLRKAGPLQLIQNSAPSTIVWCQCDIQIHTWHKMFSYLVLAEGHWKSLKIVILKPFLDFKQNFWNSFMREPFSSNSFYYIEMRTFEKKFASQVTKMTFSLYEGISKKSLWYLYSA